MSTNTRADLTKKVLRRMDMSVSDATMSGIVNDWIDEGYMDITNRGDFPFRQASASFACSAGVYSYAVASNSAINITDLGKVYDITVTDASGNPNRLEYLTRDQWEQAEVNISATNYSGMPEYWYKWADTVYLAPAPSLASYTGNVNYQRTVSVLAHDTCIPVLPERYQKYIVDYAYARALQQDGDFNEANQVFREYEAGITKMFSEYRDQTTDMPVMKQG
jgi:hypothetical protein